MRQRQMGTYGESWHRRQTQSSKHKRGHVEYINLMIYYDNEKVSMLTMQC